MTSSRVPVPLGAVVGSYVTGAPAFPFEGWAAQNRFTYPPEAREFLAQSGSAAEAFFAREFCTRADVSYLGAVARVGDLMVQMQARIAGKKVSAGITENAVGIAIDIDSAGFHHTNIDQVKELYLRDRRIAAKGFILIRFTSQEIFVDAKECWRQVNSILDFWRRK